MPVLSGSRRFLLENPNLIAGKLVETIRKPANTYKKLHFQAVIKSAASAASPIAWGEPRSRRPPAEAVVLALPAQALGEAALAADLITA